MAFFKQTCKK